jgi:hypothetical protein
MKHLKLFNDTASYEAWKNSEDYVLPNVTFTEDGNLYYNVYVAPVSPNVVVVYDVYDISTEAKILSNYSIGLFSSMIVDGVEMEVDMYHQFDAVGEHTIEFVMFDPTTLNYTHPWHDITGYGVNIISITIPPSITTISNITFTYIGNNNVDTYYIIFTSDICPSCNGPFYYIDSNLVFKYPKNADYSELINANPDLTFVAY